MENSLYIKEPTVVPIAWSTVKDKYLTDWAISHDLSGVIQDVNTPLHKLIKNRLPDKLIEFAGRHCYRSWTKGRDIESYITNILEQGHGSVLEHASISFAISGISRSCSHELVRHRAGFAWSQESQRYVDAKDIKFVIPPLYLDLKDKDENILDDFKLGCEKALEAYIKSQKAINKVTGSSSLKATNETARANLPNASETRLVMTCNLRALRHFLELRGGEGADAEIKRLSLYILVEVKKIFPLIFNDLSIFNDSTIHSQYPKV